jgi:hypothetical protein
MWLKSLFEVDGWKLIYNLYYRDLQTIMKCNIFTTSIIMILLQLGVYILHNPILNLYFQLWSKIQLCIWKQCNYEIDVHITPCNVVCMYHPYILLHTTYTMLYIVIIMHIIFLTHFIKFYHNVMWRFSCTYLFEGWMIVLID